MIYIKKLFILFIVIANICFNSKAQQPKDPDIFLVPNRAALPEIFLVGTFHFEYYNKDAYKVDKNKQIDILSAQKQKEVKELLDYISLFKPNKICIEAPEKWKAMDKYRDYRSGKKALAKDEIQQIAFRLMQRFNLDTVYSVDAGSIADDLSNNKDSLIIKPYIDSVFNDYSFRSADNYKKWRDYTTSLQTNLSLLQYFKYQNSPKVFQREYGAYLTGDFKLGKFNGADALATYWYDRNLRIFRNIQRITTSSADRILVLFGSGHISILDQLLSFTPEYDYIKFNDLNFKSNLK
ncbi:MAG TPA: DUF5694 domain-containing protein [Chitinophagaceae bacterium]|nr:DUF5694 domain-containing protein [Chitinophagaceae bacterium]